MFKHVSGDYVILLLVVSVWGLSFPALKAATADIDPLAIFVLRGLIALAIVVTIFAVTQREWRLERRDIAYLVMLGFFGSTMNPLSLTIGIAHTTASNAALLTSTSPVFGLIAAATLMRERIAISRWLGVFLALLGVVLVIAGGKGELRFGMDSVLGDLVVLGTPISWALYSVLSRPMLKRYSPFQFSAFTTISGIMIGLPLTATGAAHQPWASISLLSWGAVIFTSLAIALTPILWNSSVSRVGGATALTFMYFVPVVAVLGAFLLLGESLSLLQMVGAVIVLAGVNMANRRRSWSSKSPAITSS